MLIFSSSFLTRRIEILHFISYDFFWEDEHLLLFWAGNLQGFLGLNSLLCMELWENLKDQNKEGPVLICFVSFALQDALNQSYLGSTSYCKTPFSNMLMTGRRELSYSY